MVDNLDDYLFNWIYSIPKSHAIMFRGLNKIILVLKVVVLVLLKWCYSFSTMDCQISIVMSTAYTAIKLENQTLSDFCYFRFV